MKKDYILTVIEMDRGRPSGWSTHRFQASTEKELIDTVLFHSQLEEGINSLEELASSNEQGGDVIMLYTLTENGLTQII